MLRVFAVDSDAGLVTATIGRTLLSWVFQPSHNVQKLMVLDVHEVTAMLSEPVIKARQADVYVTW